MRLFFLGYLTFVWRIYDQCAYVVKLCLWSDPSKFIVALIVWFFCQGDSIQYPRVWNGRNCCMIYIPRALDMIRWFSGRHHPNDCPRCLGNANGAGRKAVLSATNRYRQLPDFPIEIKAKNCRVHIKTKKKSGDQKST